MPARHAIFRQNVDVTGDPHCWRPIPLPHSSNHHNVLRFGILLDTRVLTYLLRDLRRRCPRSASPVGRSKDQGKLKLESSLSPQAGEA
jgi:hypothetical protein